MSAVHHFFTCLCLRAAEILCFSACGKVRGQQIQSVQEDQSYISTRTSRVLLRLHLIFIVLNTEIKVSLLHRFHLWLTTPFLLPTSRRRQIHYNFKQEQ